MLSVGGMESSCRLTMTSTSAGPSCRKAWATIGSNLVGRFSRQPQQAGAFSHFCKVRILQIGSELQNARRLHFQFDKGQRVILEDNDFHRRLQLPQGEQISHEHGEPAIARQGHNLTAGMTDLAPRWPEARHSPSIRD